MPSVHLMNEIAGVDFRADNAGPGILLVISLFCPGSVGPIFQIDEILSDIRVCQVRFEILLQQTGAFLIDQRQRRILPINLIVDIDPENEMN